MLADNVQDSEHDSDVPEMFNVRFLENPNSEVSLYRSKAVGNRRCFWGSASGWR